MDLLPNFFLSINAEASHGGVPKSQLFHRPKGKTEYKVSLGGGSQGRKTGKEKKQPFCQG